MNYIWGGMLLVGIFYGTLTGNLQEVTNAALDSSKEAITLCISMAGIVAFWTGILKVAEKAGMLERLTKKMGPLLHFLFPELPKGHPAGNLIATNMISNFFGLGWAATPAGLKAMEELEKLEEDRRAGRLPGPVREKGTAGNEMCTFLIINISSLQLIPMNMIAYRSQYGSADPAMILGPAIVATAVSTVTAIIFCLIAHKRGG
ncbi:MAG: nucleoside recognition protein [Blautia sp.]